MPFHFSGRSFAMSGGRCSRVEKNAGIHYNAAMIYKVVETSTVTDEEIERLVNDWSSKGYAFASIHFVTAQTSRRPVMAFLFFTEPGESDLSGKAGRMDT